MQVLFNNEVKEWVFPHIEYLRVKDIEWFLENKWQKESTILLINMKRDQ